MGRKECQNETTVKQLRNLPAAHKNNRNILWNYQLHRASGIQLIRIITWTIFDSINTLIRAPEQSKYSPSQVKDIAIGMWIICCVLLCDMSTRRYCLCLCTVQARNSTLHDGATWVSAEDVLRSRQRQLLSNTVQQWNLSALRGLAGETICTRLDFWISSYTWYTATFAANYSSTVELQSFQNVIS